MAARRRPAAAALDRDEPVTDEDRAAAAALDAADASPARRYDHRKDPDFVGLRPGQRDPSTGARVPVPGGRDRPRWATDDFLQAESDAHAASRTPRGRAAAGARRVAGFKAPTLGALGRRGGGAVSVAPARLRTDASGFVLAVAFWSWVALPALQGGPPQVKATLRAKFFNRGATGFLP